MRKFTTMLFLITLLGFTRSALANNLNFETTAEGISRTLLEQNTGQQKNGTPIREMTMRKIRTMQYIGKEPLKMHKTITAADNSRLQSVNLNIKFDSDSYNIRPSSYTLLNELGIALVDERLKDKSITIIGHTDSDGSLQHNIQLSLNRAKAVKSYLTQHFNILSERMKIVGYGEAMPLVHNMSERNKQINRRVEIGIRTSP